MLQKYILTSSNSAFYVKIINKSDKTPLLSNFISD